MNYVILASWVHRNLQFEDPCGPRILYQFDFADSPVKRKAPMGATGGLNFKLIQYLTGPEVQRLLPRLVWTANNPAKLVLYRTWWI